MDIFLLNFLIFMLGTSFGSFVSALVYRREVGISIVSPPSFCDFCGKRILKRDLVPVLSFLFLKGKTRCCGQKISKDKVLVEITAGFAFVFVFKSYNNFEGLFLLAALLFSLLISLTDFKFLEIYDKDLKILLIIGFVYRLIFLKINLKFLSICFVFTLIFMLVRWISKGGLGDGDLFFYLGLFCFLENYLITRFILLSIWIGAFFAIIKAIRQKSLKGSIALCPAISIAFLLVVIFKDWLWKNLDLLL